MARKGVSKSVEIGPIVHSIAAVHFIITRGIGIVHGRATAQGLENVSVMIIREILSKVIPGVGFDEKMDPVIVVPPAGMDKFRPAAGYTEISREPLRDRGSEMGRIVFLVV